MIVREVKKWCTIRIRICNGHLVLIGVDFSRVGTHRKFRFYLVLLSLIETNRRGPHAKI